MALHRVLRSVRMFSQATASQVHTGFSLLPALSTIDQHRDCLKVASQHVSWTYSELDVSTNQRYSLAFALGLAEMGLAQGDKVAFWAARSESAEIVALQIACARVGAQVVSCTHEDHLPDSLSSAKFLIFSPWASSSQSSQKRVDKVISLLPETKATHWGAPLKSSAFPQLKYVVQLGFTTIRGMVKARQVGVYSRESEASVKLSGPQAASPFFTSPGISLSLDALQAASHQLASELHLSKGQTLLNVINPKHASSLLGTMATASAAARVVLPGNDKHFGRLAKSQHPSAILLDRMSDFAGGVDVETLVVVEKSGLEVEALAAKLHDINGLKAKRVVGVSAHTLGKL